MTLLFKADKISEAARIIKKGGTVAFPTETVYGLGANALDAKAVKKIFKAKGRPPDNPLIVHIADKKDVYKLAKRVPLAAEKLMHKFWPGPLTLVLEKSSSVPRSVTAGLDTVAVRMPENKIALSLIRRAGVPIAAPSANFSGKPSPTKAEHVIFDLLGKVDAIIDGGKTKIGVESTVIDLTSKIPTVLRPGKITLEELRRVLGKVEMHKSGKNTKAKSPGMKHRHYAPEAKLIVVEGRPLAVKREMAKLAAEYKKRGIKTALLSAGKNPSKYAGTLFAKLREFDKRKISVIICEGIKKSGFGAAIMDRLERASDGNVVEV